LGSPTTNDDDGDTVHGVSKKTVHFCFCQNFVEYPPTLVSFGR